MARMRNVNPSAQHDGNAARAKTAGARENQRRREGHFSDVL